MTFRTLLSRLPVLSSLGRTFRTTGFAALAAAILSTSATAQAPGRLQTAGQVGMHSKPGIVHLFGAIRWTAIQQMKGAVTLPAGGDLSVDVSVDAELVGPASRTLYARLVVDGRVARPSYVRLIRGVTRRNATATFFLKGLSPGAHRVQVEGYVTSGVIARLYQRTLLFRFATANSSKLALGLDDSPGTTRQAGTWSTVTGLSTRVYRSGWSLPVINLSGEVHGYGTPVRFRAVVNGRSTGDVILAETASRGVRTFAFVGSTLPTGYSTVTIEWTSTRFASITRPVLSVAAFAVGDPAVSVMRQQRGSPSDRTTSGSFRAIAGLGGNASIPTLSDVFVRLSGEFAAHVGATIEVRAKMDGKVIGSAAALAGEGSQYISGQQLGFIVRNVKRGLHRFDVEWRRTGSGSAWIIDRTLIVESVVGQHPVLVTAMESSRPIGYKYGGFFSSLVVDTINNRRVFRPFVRDTLFYTMPGIADWFSEQSRGLANVVEAAVCGPYLKKYDEKFYRTYIPQVHTVQRTEAVLAADADFDYSDYDRNSDGVVKMDELDVLIIHCEDNVGGVARSVRSVQTNDRVTVDLDLAAVGYMPDFRTKLAQGLINHELAHSLFAARDLYADDDPTSPGPFSLMARHSYNTHLDPMHKTVQSDWFSASTVSRDAYVWLKPVSQNGRVLKLQNKARSTLEYFMVEHRDGGYDTGLPARGLAVWHIDETLGGWGKAIEIEPEMGTSGPRQNYRYLFKGTAAAFDPSNEIWDGSPNRDTRWHGGAKSGIGIFGIEKLTDGRMKAFIDVPGPGIFVDLDRASYWNSVRDPYVTVRVRLKNTGSANEFFRVTTTAGGMPVSRPSAIIYLPSYGETTMTLRVKVTALATLVVNARGTTSGASTTDTAKLYSWMPSRQTLR